MQGITSWLVILALLSAAPALGKTLVVEGKLNGTVTVNKTVAFASQRKLAMLSYRLPVPASYDAAGNLQQLQGFEVAATPAPQQSSETTDSFGNRYRVLTWDAPPSDPVVKITYTTSISANLTPRSSSTPFPLPGVREAEKVFLKPTPLVQSDAPQVIELARELTRGAASEHQAVTAILTHVADALTYQYRPDGYDALCSLRNRRGNCQNFSHLALALLRASGIPARICIGQTLKEKWKIPLDGRGGSLVEGMAEGLHAWIEVFYPDLGWLPCDPQQSRLFTSTRHIKFGHGLDAGDVQESWRGSPGAPGMTEAISTSFHADTVDLRLRETLAAPARHIVAWALFPAPPPSRPGSPPPQRARPEPLPAPEPPAPAPPPPTPLQPPAKSGSTVEFGNQEFPRLTELYEVVGNTGHRSFDSESAELATSGVLYAQAFNLRQALQVDSVSLAMRRFGGDGSIYLDVVSDEKGKPGLEGIRSLPVYLESITPQPGYYWVLFRLPEGASLRPGKHWIVLRHSGDAIMNWFITPGKREGGADDTRSTARGWQWEDVLAGEFVYKVRGVVR